MAKTKQATGEALKWNEQRKRYEKRVKLCGHKVLFPLPQCTTPGQAKARETILIKLAAQLTVTQVPFLLARQSLRKVAVAGNPSDDNLTEQDACALIDEVLNGWRGNADRAIPTLDQLFARWQSNELHRLYPDSVEWRDPDSTIYRAGRNYENYVQPIAGHLPVPEITLTIANKIKDGTAHMPISDSRRQALQPFKQILDLAKLLGYIKASPLPDEWLPKRAKPSKRRKLQFLYPSEEALLCAGFSPEQQALIRSGIDASTLTPVVPFEWRMLWAFICRHGRRKTETTLMQLDQLTWRKGKCIVQLRSSQTKFGKEHAWVLDTPSTRALRLYIALRRKHALPTDRLFVTPDGLPINPESIPLPELLREHLWAVGVRRPELHASVASESRQIVVHDLRATHVTVKAATGASDNEIMKVTGQENSETVRLYKRRADVAAMFEEGDFTDFDLALPELCAPGTFRLPELQDDAAPSENDLPEWLLQRQLRASPASHAPVVALPAQTPTRRSLAPAAPAQASGHTLATDLAISRENGGQPYCIVQHGQPAQPPVTPESPAIQAVVVQSSPAGSDFGGHTMAGLQAQLAALQAVVAGGLAAQVAAQLAALQQAQQPPKQARKGRQ